MRPCKDDITTHVKKFKYNAIYPPRTDASPLEVLTKHDGSLMRWGYLGDVFSSSVSLPLIHENSDPLEIEGTITSKHDSSIGITILGKLLSAVGGNFGIKAAYKNTSSLTFRYREVTRYFVMPIELDRYISMGAPNLILATTAEMLKKDRLFIFTAVLKAKKIVVEAEKIGGGSLKVDVPTVKEIVGGNISISDENEESTKIGYQGKIPAGFGFKAVRIDVDGEKIRLKPLASETMSASNRDKEEEPDGKYEIQLFNEDYITLL